MNNELTIYAGPCSVDDNNISEIKQVAEIEVIGNRAIYGTRVVGLKSRTGIDLTGTGMGMDYHAVTKNVEILRNGGCTKDLVMLPSVEIAMMINQETKLAIATEIMIASAQLPLFDGKLQNGRLMPWNPSVNQLGWSLYELGEYAKKNNWDVGIKNAKWIGEKFDLAEDINRTDPVPIEKVWGGVVNYVGEQKGEIRLIQRGVDEPGKGNYRNIPIHQIAKRTKLTTGAKLYFDPSHIYGSKMRDDIVDATIAAMKMKIDESTYLYDGILIETGTSKTDTDQHISLIELEGLVTQLAKFRNLRSPE